MRERHHLSGSVEVTRAERFVMQLPVWVLALLAIVGASFFGIIVIAPMDIGQQAAFGTFTIVLLVILRRGEGRVFTLVLMLLALAVTFRYLVWRVTETIGFMSILEAVLGYGLLAAEIYRVIVLCIGYMQTVWPLDRQPVALPEDTTRWPTVDVMIPTYNESLEIVRTTVLAALNLDYPKHKLVVHILDDGRRPEFKQFAKDIGVNYIIRPDNKHAKAGNLNHALTQTSSDLIVIFDCDHIPTRAFLQLTVGWFLRDGKMALLQTPHHFYSPDPFERNLRLGSYVPNEDRLFYGLIQDGNDLWDAAFFCGSCAIARRAALMSIGGFAVETVTEDAHTALKLHRRGWHTGFLKIPLAAGLATERLSLHIGQRMRWARGMTQIFRIDNPMLGRGLALGQRLCYLSSMLHFFFALPRIVFVTAPLAYLVFGVSIIHASGLAVLAFVAPVVIHTTATNSMIQGKFRHSFWNEVYESTLAFYLLGPTVMTLLNPRKGKFNVTDKGGLVGQGFLDTRIVKPQFLIAGALLLGVVLGIVRLFYASPLDPTDVILLNLVWAVLNLIILAASIGVALEAKQIRNQVRLRLALPTTVRLPDGRSVVSETEDVSLGGAALPVARPPGAPTSGELLIALPCGSIEVYFPAQIVGWDSKRLRVRFERLPVELERELVRATFGRADAWTAWNESPPDKPLTSFARIIQLGVKTIGRLGIIAAKKSVGRGEKPKPDDQPPKPPGAKPLQRAAGLLLAGWLGLQLVDPAAAQLSAPMPPNPAVRQLAPPAAAPDLPPLRSVLPEEAESSTVTYDFADLGVPDGMRLRGVEGEGGITFSIRRDEVVTAASLRLQFAYSPTLLADISHLHVRLNGELLRSIQLENARAGGVVADLPIDPVLLQEDNNLGFEFTGHYTRSCEDPLHSSLWATISRSSRLSMTSRRLPVPNDLGLLPRPFFDRRDMRPLSVPMVFGGVPTNAVLEAATAVSSWFGALAAYRTARFPAHFDTLPRGHAVVFVVGSQRPGGFSLPPIEGPTITVMENPADPEYKLLVVAGRDEAEVKTAAMGLVLGRSALTGSTTTVAHIDAGPRTPYDAPRWIPIDRPVRFGEIVPQQDLQARGFTGYVRIGFRAAPDLFSWGGNGIPLSMHWSHSAGDWVDLDYSRIDVLLNGSFVDTTPMVRPWKIPILNEWFGRSEVIREASMKLPPYLLTGDNQLLFVLNSVPKRSEECKAALPREVMTRIDPNGEIDLSALPHFAELPNLSYFANSGFPYTRLADLGSTAVIMAAEPTSAEIEALMTIAGRFGDSTGYPTLRLRVARPGEYSQVSDRDLIVIGLFGRQPMLQRLGERAPLVEENGQVRLSTGAPATLFPRLFDDRAERELRNAARLAVGSGNALGAMYAMESPFASGRSLIVVAGMQQESLDTVTTALSNRKLLPAVQGDLVLINADQISSFRVADTYTIGTLPWFTWLRYHLAGRPVLVGLSLLVAILMLAAVIYRLLAHRARRRLEAQS